VASVVPRLVWYQSGLPKRSALILLNDTRKNDNEETKAISLWKMLTSALRALFKQSKVVTFIKKVVLLLLLHVFDLYFQDNISKIP